MMPRGSRILVQRVVWQVAGYVDPRRHLFPSSRVSTWDVGYLDTTIRLRSERMSHERAEIQPAGTQDVIDTAVLEYP